MALDNQLLIFFSFYRLRAVPSIAYSPPRPMNPIIPQCTAIYYYCSVNNGILYLEVLESVCVRPNQEHVAPLEAGRQLLRPSDGIGDVAVAEVDVHLERARSPDHADASLENRGQEGSMNTKKRCLARHGTKDFLF